jgi:hypothetical protein
MELLIFLKIDLYINIILFILLSITSLLSKFSKDDNKILLYNKYIEYLLYSIGIINAFYFLAAIIIGLFFIY